MISYKCYKHYTVLFRVGILLSAALCVILYFNTTANAQLNQFDKMRLSDKFETFDDGWQMQWGDSPIDADGVPAWTKSEAGWQPVEKLDSPPGREGKNFIWYKKALRNNNWNDPCIYIPWAFYTFQVYIDGKNVYQHGVDSSGNLSSFSGFSFHLIPYTKDNTGKYVYIRVYSEGAKRIGLAKGILIGSIHAIHIKQLRKDAPRAIISFLVLSLSIFMIFMFIRAPREGGLYLAFGIFLLSMGIWNYSTTHWRGFFFSLGKWDIYVELYALFLAPPSLVFYFDQVFKDRYKKIIKWVARIFSVFFIAGVLSSFAGPIFLYERFLPIFQTFAIPLMIFPFGFVAYRAFTQKDTEAQILIGGLFVFILTSIYDLLMSFMGWASHMPRLTYFGMLIMMIMQAIIIGRRFRLMTQNLKLYSGVLEAAKTELEQKVIERTEKLAEEREELDRRNFELEETKSSLMQKNSELQIAKHIAEEANKSKDRFLATLSHELRTPLNGILGISSLMLERNLKDEDIHTVQMIKQSGENLFFLIQDLLDFTTIENNQISIKNSFFSLGDLMDNISIGIKDQVENKNLTFIKKAVPENAIVFSDKTRISQIIINLVTNSIKYTRRGSIELIVSVDNKLTIKVTDTGIGIEKNKINTIFEAFTRIENDYVKNQSGLGLGLSIVSQIIRMMNGTINVESQPEKGSIFTVELPLEKISEQENRVESAKESDHTIIINKKILVVEDNAINRFYFNSILSRAGALVDEAINGENALFQVDTVKYDIILMDLNMPDFDGLFLTRIIRNTHNMNVKTPISALSAHAYKDHIKHCLEAGMNDFISKPVEREQFLNAVSSLLKSVIV